MDAKMFERPVRLALKPGEAIGVGSAREAALLLVSVDWPGERQAAHRDALDAAEKALDGHRSVVDARNALILAAREAGVLIEEAGSS